MLRKRTIVAGSALTASLVFCADPAAAAKVRICQGQEQAYEQVKPAATPLQVNAALFAAAEKGCTELVRKLLDDGASLQARDRLGATPLGRAAKAGKADVVELMLARGAKIDARDLDGSTPLYLAAEAGSRAAAEVLIAHGADVNLPGRSGATPLAAAAFMGSDALSQVLLKAGAAPDVVDGTGKAPICYAAGRGFPAVVRLLLDRGVDPNRRYGNDLTALMWAAGYSDEAGTADMDEIVKLLIAHGAHVNDADNRGRTPLMIAASLGHSGIAEVLLGSGADAALRDKAGKSAGNLAASDALRTRLSAN